MNIHLSQVRIEQKEVLASLLQLYLYEFSQFTNEEYNEKGVYTYKYFEQYWLENNRKPFFIISDNKIVGFVLINLDDPESSERGIHTISEFFVAKIYRKQQIGTKAAELAFNMYRGRWIIRELINNLGAQEFWHKVLESYTSNSYKEKEDSGHIIQEFTN